MTINKIRLATDPAAPDGRQLSAVRVSRNMVLEEEEVVAPTAETGVFVRRGVERCTIYVSGVRGESFQIEVCYRPVFTGGNLDVGASLWMPVGGLAVVPLNTAVPATVAQTITDVGYGLRVQRVTGTGNFTVRVWELS